MITLDNLFEELKLNKVKLLKIDVEGFELEVIHGLLKKIDIVENIIIEILTPLADTSAREEEIFAFLKEHNFELKNIVGQPLEKVKNLQEYNLLATKNI
ncbi:MULTISPECIES: FkbM family methyltransferase [Calothrix]|uniref:FkbM family methyltransferase n=2 Tax=Calothrix TaxID=1186 RepID=A0ABR8AL42_9CYAN|nr:MULTISPECIES: FkbM family methyltransferase [Calothrix]MBD2200795.1 FkbM family methyltransferase [Calothrix parietina FACHB-288]MBD2229822.1 FkbM family methyltransferase [Calothrix anomala FACHB-343]